MNIITNYFIIYKRYNFRRCTCIYNYYSRSNYICYSSYFPLYPFALCFNGCLFLRFKFYLAIQYSRRLSLLTFLSYLLLQIFYFILYFTMCLAFAAPETFVILTSIVLLTLFFLALSFCSFLTFLLSLFL